MMKISQSILALTAFLGIGVASAAFVPQDDAKAQFSSTENPHSVWRYGWSSTLGGPLHVYHDLYDVHGAELWSDASIVDSTCPHVSYYPLNVPYLNIEPHSMYMHPGPGNQFSHCVWTAPATGVYNIRARFTSISTGDPRAYILKNGNPIDDSQLTQGNAWVFSRNTVALAAGDTIDAAVGVGPSNSFVSDETKFSFTITRGANVPIPSGDFKGSITGNSGPGLFEGVLTAHILKTGELTGELKLGPLRIPLKGSFNPSGEYSTVAKLRDGSQLTISLSVGATRQLTGTISYYHSQITFILGHQLF
jgi:hypothetical protein